MISMLVEKSLQKLWCGRGDLNPHAFRRHPLKMVCLPVPPLPQGNNCNGRAALHYSKALGPVASGRRVNLLGEGQRVGPTRLARALCYNGVLRGRCNCSLAEVVELADTPS